MSILMLKTGNYVCSDAKDWKLSVQMLNYVCSDAKDWKLTPAKADSVPCKRLQSSKQSYPCY